MASKRCSKCGEVKPAGDFYRDGKSRGGYRPECKRCRNRQRAQWARRRYVPKTGRRYRTKADRLEEQGVCSTHNEGGKLAMSSKTGTEKGYSISALARMAGVDRRTLASRLGGVTPLESGPKGKLYRLSDVVRGFISQPLQAEEVDDPQLLALRARKLEAEAGLAELKLQKERGEVLDRREVLSDVRTQYRELYVRLTVAVPQLLGPRLAATKTAAQAEEILRVELEREFQELRAEHAQYLEEGGGADNEAGAES